MPRTPIVVIPGRFSASASALRYRAVVTARALSEAVLRAGGEPVTVHPWAPGGSVTPEQVADRLRFADAVLLPGGGDLSPERYGQAVAHDAVYDVDHEQDAFDLAVAEWALGAGVPLLAVCRGTQVVNVLQAPILTQGMAMNMNGLDQSISRDLGVLDYCRLHDITVQAWSPFQAGFFTGVFLGNPDYPELNAVVDRLAAAYDVPPEAIATAWITRHPARMQVVLGTTTPERVRAAALGADVELTRPEWYALYRAAGHLVP